MPIYVKAHTRTNGHQVRSHVRRINPSSRSVMNKRVMNKLMRANNVGGTLNISSPESVRRQIKMLNMAVGITRGLKSQRDNRRRHLRHKQMLNDTYRFK